MVPYKVEVQSDAVVKAEEYPSSWGQQRTSMVPQVQWVLDEPSLILHYFLVGYMRVVCPALVPPRPVLLHLVLHPALPPC